MLLLSGTRLEEVGADLSLMELGDEGFNEDQELWWVEETECLLEDFHELEVRLEIFLFHLW